MSKLLVDQLSPTDGSDTINVSDLQHTTNVATYGARDGGDAATLQQAFQAAINALPATGGFIQVNVGDYSNLDPSSLVIPVNKMINLLAPYAILPDGMPFNVWKTGYQVQPYENSAATGVRPGAAYLRLIAKDHTPNTTQQNQQDSILYLEGHSPSVEGNIAQEFAALRFNMSSKMYDTVNTPVSNLDIKGLQGIVVGDSGNAKVRSLRTTSAAINGHYGLVTGGMFWAHRSGVIPTQAPFNGNGTDTWQLEQAGPYLSGDAAIIAQVGPGIQANFRFEGGTGRARPQFGILQGRGTQAVLPEIAVLALHGGGNGQIMNIVRSDTDTTQIGYVSRLAEVQMASFSSKTSTVADDAVVTVTPPATTGFIDVFCGGTSSNWVRAFFRVGTTPVMTASGQGSASAVTTGALTGTTATDGQFTISAAADGLIYIENRTGQSRGVCMHFTCSPAA